MCVCIEIIKYKIKMIIIRYMCVCIRVVGMRCISMCMPYIGHCI